MNRFTRRDTSSSFTIADVDDKLYERQALIDEDHDETNASPLGVRNRQYVSRSNANNNNNYNDLNGHELRRLNGPSSGTRDLISEPYVEYTHYDIQPGDSLQKICLRYACPVNQVKRLNGMMTDQEFYGLRRIKLPLGKLGLLEDVIRSHQQQGDLDERSFSPSSEQDLNARSRMVNSPGSALSISSQNHTKFKPLLSPGLSSDRIHELNEASNQSNHRGNGLDIISQESLFKAQHSHSHSFSSMRDFANDNVNIDLGVQQNHIETRQLNQQAFIKSTQDEQTSIDDMIMMNHDKVGKIFEDLDYHVERAKVAAESYDQRAAELVETIDNNTTGPTPLLHYPKPRISKLPELFFCNENFGLSYKKLIVFIFVVCLIGPLVYINQSSVVSTRV